MFTFHATTFSQVNGNGSQQERGSGYNGVNTLLPRRVYLQRCGVAWGYLVIRSCGVVPCRPWPPGAHQIRGPWGTMKKQSGKAS